MVINDNERNTTWHSFLFGYIKCLLFSRVNVIPNGRKGLFGCLINKRSKVTSLLLLVTLLSLLWRIFKGNPRVACNDILTLITWFSKLECRFLTDVCSAVLCYHWRVNLRPQKCDDLQEEIMTVMRGAFKEVRTTVNFHAVKFVGDHHLPLTS